MLFFSYFHFIILCSVSLYVTHLPKTITKVILIVFILAFGITPLELLELIQVSVFFLPNRTVTVPEMMYSIKYCKNCLNK